MPLSLYGFYKEPGYSSICQSQEWNFFGLILSVHGAVKNILILYFRDFQGLKTEMRTTMKSRVNCIGPQRALTSKL